MDHWLGDVPRPAKVDQGQLVCCDTPAPRCVRQHPPSLTPFVSSLSDNLRPVVGIGGLAPTPALPLDDDLATAEVVESESEKEDGEDVAVSSTQVAPLDPWVVRAASLGLRARK